MPDLSRQELAALFDHAALMPEVGEAEIEQVCREAAEFGFFSVAVNPIWVTQCTEHLRGTTVKILSVSGFPLAANRTDIKVAEAAKGVADGAHEIDMVANVGWLASNRFLEAEQEITAVRRDLPHNIILKVIIEAGKLTTEQQKQATRAVINGGAQFVKTCTGFFGGATVEQVQTLAEAAGGKIEVKASGGIKTLSQSLDLVEAGSTRLGSSSSVSIMREFDERN